MVTAASSPASAGTVAAGIATEADGGAWDRFVEGHPEATGYHEWAWRQVFVGAFRHKPLYVVARRGTEIAGVLPMVRIASMLFGRTLTSLPFLNYGGVLARDDESARQLLIAATAIAREEGCRHVELRHFHRRFPELPCKQHKVTMRLKLQPGMWERLDRKVRNQVRKAQKSGLTAEDGGRELLPAFYAVFARNMRDLGTPVYPRRFFEHIVGAFPGRARVHVVRLRGAAVAAGVSFRTRETVEVPWASSIRDVNALCPNHLLYWNILDGAVGAGCEVLDFGRSTPDEGTFRFKAQWGAEPTPLHWEYRLMPGADVPDASPKNPKFQFAINVWKRMPLAIATRVGPAIVRGIP